MKITFISNRYLFYFVGVICTFVQLEGGGGGGGVEKCVYLLVTCMHLVGESSV